MGYPGSAVLMMEEALCSGMDHPLMLEPFLGAPVLSWMGRELLALGTRRIFLACAPAWAQEARACLQEAPAVLISDRREDLSAFLDTEESVLVLCRSALPMAQAGAGFAYAAPGTVLREAWRHRLTNAVQDSELIPGWLPVYGPETLQELEPLFQSLHS